MSVEERIAEYLYGKMFYKSSIHYRLKHAYEILELIKEAGWMSPEDLSEIDGGDIE